MGYLPSLSSRMEDYMYMLGPEDQVPNLDVHHKGEPRQAAFLAGSTRFIMAALYYDCWAFWGRYRLGTYGCQFMSGMDSQRWYIGE